jgi:hypothetical protein
MKIYIIRVKEGNNLWCFATDSLHQFTITFSLSLSHKRNSVYTLTTKSHNIAISLNLCRWRTGLRHVLWVAFPGKATEELYVFSVLALRNHFHLLSQTKAHTDKIWFFVYYINIPRYFVVFYLYLLYATTMIHKTTENSRETEIK